jgi:uncharacterized membrane protein
MDVGLLTLRVVHITAAMLWVGGGIMGSFFLGPTAQALGPSGQAFMDHLAKQRRMSIYFPAVATLTVVAGAFLYWRDSGGLRAEWITSPTGLAFSLGALAGIASLVLGGILVGPSLAEDSAVRAELAAAGAAAVPTVEQQRRLERAAGKMRLANRVDLPLILIAVVLMATARYL